MDSENDISGYEVPDDGELIVMSLNMYANWIQTRDPNLSLVDYRDMKKDEKKLPKLDGDQRLYIVRIRELARKVRRVVDAYKE